MPTEWLISSHDIEIAVDIAREIGRSERAGDRIGARFGLDYATDLPFRDVEPVDGVSISAQQSTA
jgi:hypothetical protein